MNKVSFVTMDVESFYDTNCVKRSGKNIPNDEYDCSNEVKRFIDFLNERNIKATFFVTVDFLPRCKEFLLYAIKNGHEIALHCLHHVKANKMPDSEFDASIKEAKKIIKEELGVDVKGIRLPCFRGKKQHKEIIKNNGFIYDSSEYKTSKNNKLNSVVFNDGGFYEFKLPRTPIFKINISGGGCVRLIPWWFIKHQINRHIKHKDAYLSYLHPFEIYEGKLPKVKGIELLQTIYLNRGRKVYLSKIDYIINALKESGFDFMTMSGYIELYERGN